MKKEFIETERCDGDKKYTREGAIKRIKALLKGDKELLGSRKLKSISDEDLIEIGFNHFGFQYI